MKRMSNLQSRKKQKGIGLISVVFAVIIFGIISAAAVNQYNQQEAATNRNNLRMELLRFFGSMKENKRAYGSYVGITNQSVYQSAKLISQMYKSTTANQFITPYTDNGIDFAPTGTATDRSGKSFSSANNYIKVTIKDVPIEMCADTVDDFIDAVVQVMVGETRIDGIATRDKACSEGKKVNVVLTNL